MTPLFGAQLSQVEKIVIYTKGGKSSYKCLGFPRGLFPAGFPTNILQEFFTSRISHLIVQKY
jgi:hypothetical protein